MSRYIDADKLIQDLNEFYANADCRWQRGRDAGIGINIAKQIVENQPTADVQEAKHGEWLLEREPCGKPYCYHCTICDSDFHHTGIKVAWDFCPNCGAKMDKGEQE